MFTLNPQSTSTLFQEAVQLVRDGQDPHMVAGEMVERLTQEEQLYLLDGDTHFWPGLQDLLSGSYKQKTFIHGQVDRLGIPGIRFCDGPRGITMGGGTAFPVTMARGATWDTALEERVGFAIGREGRAQGANLIGSVCINLPRHPAWGRAQETYGEDPILLGELGAAHTRGLQKNAMACVKHFALNSMEIARFQVDVACDEATLHETYLPHFKRLVDEGALSIMSSYNSVNGNYAGENYELLTRILRHQWGFKGFVISDWVFGLRNAVLSVKAGLDIEAPFMQQRFPKLPEALKSGDLLPSNVQGADIRIIASQLKHYATRHAQEVDKSVIFSSEHRELARQVASRSIVLLKNEDVAGRILLPLSAQTAKVAVIGRLACSEHTGDQGSSLVHCPEVVSPYKGLKRAFPESDVILSDSNSVEDAEAAASAADVAIVIVGYDAGDEGEYLFPSLESNPELGELFPDLNGMKGVDIIKSMVGTRKEGGAGFNTGRAKGGDRENIRLCERDVEIIHATVAVNPKTIVCVVGSGTVIMEEWRHNVPAILMIWYNGTEGGTALGDVLLGRIDSGGRLPYTIPKHEDHLPPFDINARKIQYTSSYGQRRLDTLGVQAAYPLGYGLSYTSFTLSDLKVTASLQAEHLRVRLTVANIGGGEGRYVVQVYGKDANGAAPRALLGFASVNLEPGASSPLDFEVSTRPLQRWSTGKMMLSGSVFTVEVGGNSGDLSALTSEYCFENAML